MTQEEFRSDANRVKDLRDALANPTLQEALLVIHDGKTIMDAADDAPELASVRILSNLTGRADVIRELYQLATMPTAARVEPLPTFGVTESPPPDWQPL